MSKPQRIIQLTGKHLNYVDFPGPDITESEAKPRAKIFIENTCKALCDALLKELDEHEGVTLGTTLKMYLQLNSEMIMYTNPPTEEIEQALQQLPHFVRLNDATHAR